MKIDKEKYKRYLNSKKWKDIKEIMFGIHGRNCSACGSKYHLQIHHKTYERLYKENLNDLMILCDVCHGKHHRNNRKMKKKRDTNTVTYYPNRKF